MADEPKTVDIRENLDLVEKAEKVDDGEVEIAADDGGVSALVQKAAKVKEDEAKSDS